MINEPKRCLYCGAVMDLKYPNKKFCRDYCRYKYFKRKNQPKDAQQQQEGPKPQHEAIAKPTESGQETTLLETTLKQEQEEPQQGILTEQGAEPQKQTTTPQPQQDTPTATNVFQEEPKHKAGIFKRMFHRG